MAVMKLSQKANQCLQIVACVYLKCKSLSLFGNYNFFDSSFTDEERKNAHGRKIRIR